MENYVIVWELIQYVDGKSVLIGLYDEMGESLCKTAAVVKNMLGKGVFACGVQV